jgi:hypothetical protein
MHECRYKCERQQSTCLVRDDLECADPSHPQSDNIESKKIVRACQGATPCYSCSDYRGSLIKCLAKLVNTFHSRGHAVGSVVGRPGLRYGLLQGRNDTRMIFFDLEPTNYEYVCGRWNI